MSFADFTALDVEQRGAKTIQHINNNARNLRLLSPAESMNALTVGAVFFDSSAATENARWVLPCSDGMLSPISALGKGLNSSVKPDIIFPGGRNFVMEDMRHLGQPTAVWRSSNAREPGTLSAAPYDIASGANQVMYSFGTSNAAALLSHEASRCYDTLLEIFDFAGVALPHQQTALLIKAMLIHGAEWRGLKDILVNTLGIISREKYSEELHRFIGYGELLNGEAHLYNLPLPFDFSSGKVLRRLTATLTYFTPIIPTRQAYRAAQVWFTRENPKTKFLDSRVDVDWQAVQRGSVQHEIFEDDDIVVWGEDEALQLKINCHSVADDHLAVPIPYAIMVSFEIKSEIDVKVYEAIAEKILPRVTV